MMFNARMPAVITGLDIGSSKISCAVAETRKDGTLQILAQGFYPSRGVWRGAPVDLGEVIDSVSKALAAIRAKISRRPDNIYVSISGETLKAEKSRGMIPIALRGREITKHDMERCVNVASTIQLPYNREIIHRIVQNFSIDEQSWIKNPVGLYASRLTCEVYIITANINHIQNIYKCINEAGYDVTETVFTGMAEGESLLEAEDKEAGAAILDVGASLAEISIFSGGTLRDIGIVPLGTQDLKGDFKDSAEFKNILSETKKRIDDFIGKGGKVQSVVISGGIAFADGIIEYMEETLPYPIRVGTVKDVRGDISSLDSMRAASAIGLIRYAHKKYSKKVLEEKNVVRRLSTKVVDIFNNYF